MPFSLAELSVPSVYSVVQASIQMRLYSEGFSLLEEAESVVERQSPPLLQRRQGSLLRFGFSSGRPSISSRAIHKGGFARAARAANADEHHGACHLRFLPIEYRRAAESVKKKHPSRFRRQAGRKQRVFRAKRLQICVLGVIMIHCVRMLIAPRTD